MQPEPLSGWSVGVRGSRRSSPGGERLKLVGGSLREPMEAQLVKRDWFATRALRSSQFAGICLQRLPRWLGFQSGLVLRNNGPTAHVESQMRVVPQPTAAESD